MIGVGYETNDPRVQPFLTAGASIVSATIRNQISEITAGVDNWITIKINGKEHTVEICVRPNKTGQQRKMNICISADIGLMYSFKNDIIHVIQMAS